MLLESLESSRLFNIGHLLTAQYISECQGSVNDTELLNIALVLLVGERVINTLLNCIINKARKLILLNR